MKITFPSNTRDTVSGIIDAIGREVEFLVYSSYACSGCLLDPITQTSTDSFCPICSGQYWIPVYSSYIIKAHVLWKNADFKQYERGGWNFIGDGIVKVLHDDTIMDVISNTHFIVIDDKHVSVEKITLLGVPEINRVIIDFKEEEK